MSTKALAEVLRKLPKRRGVVDAVFELDTIRRAAAVIHAERTGETYSETEYAEAIALMGRIAQEAK